MGRADAVPLPTVRHSHPILTSTADVRGRRAATAPVTGADYLNQVQKYVVSSTMTEPKWQNSTVLSGDP